MRVPAGGFLVPLLLVACAGAPAGAPTSTRRVTAIATPRGTRIVRGSFQAPLAALDPYRVARLARALFTDPAVSEAGHEIRVDLDSPESAEALYEAARWADGMILARRELEARTGPETGSAAGIVAEAIRRWLRPDEPDRLPDWGELSRALESPSIWKTAPVTAGMGAVIFAGMMLSREPAGPARERAARILSQAVAAKDVPGWLSWIAYYAWSRRDFLASEESPNSR